MTRRLVMLGIRTAIENVLPRIVPRRAGFYGQGICPQNHCPLQILPFHADFNIGFVNPPRVIIGA